MRKHRVLKVIGCVAGAIVILLLYEMIGIFVAYKKQPELSEETKQSLHPEDIYTDASVEERACIIEENGDALLQRVRLIEQAKEDLQAAFATYYEAQKDAITDTDFVKDTVVTDKITLISNPIHTGAKEPTAWYEMGVLMKQAKKRVKIHTPYIICNDMMYDTWTDVAANVPEFTVMTNSVANNGNPFGAADYQKNRDKISSTGITIWEYEGGYSYHGKSILIDDDISIIGSFNMDMRSVYLDTELMLVIRSKEINAQLESAMMQYEQGARQVLADGQYANPYHVEPIALTPKRRRRVFVVRYLLGWLRFLF